ncbi:tetratricopeptide repeat protein [Gemmatimonas sp.]|uniref:tetratricopeptide repeat protein n=1 Tax=Gemmatimonas sp. TaxID=1962908 RepID=UPI0035623FE7
MSTAARIDELRKKFEESPRRYFAPLANELRKAGNLSEAIALCREFLPKQPEHMSGYIVFGQALYESGDLSEARIVFEQALALDPENLKALRHLGDIAKWEGDTAGARRWYERVLEADPRNDDIAAQLATLVTPAYAGRVVTEAEAVAPTPFAPPSFTPAFSMAPIGFGAIPTPDAALRAVDFDEINARLRESEPQPIELVATHAPAAVARGALEPDLLDLDAIEAAGIESDAEIGEHSIDAAADDPFGFNESPTDDEPFEEGLIAPEWPDTSALEVRRTPPRSVTPPFVGPITPDAIAAFGVEPGDPLPAPSLGADEGIVDVEPQFGQREAHSTEIAARRDAEPEYGFAVERQAERETEDDVEAAADVQAEAEVELVDEIDEIDAAEPEWVVASAPMQSSLVEEELPWLVPAPAHDVEIEAEIEADTVMVAEVEPDDTAFLVDGTSGADVVELASSPAEASFADVMPEEYNPAFVTETMGELLVSQGFTARAVSVYDELVRRRPYDPVLSSRLAELQERLAAEAVSSAPAVPTRAFATPAFVTRVMPRFATPLSVTPLSSPVFEVSASAQAAAEAPAERVSARERFARLAARRVPRRTPPRASVAVETPTDGLASLFGDDAPMPDDLAARALADAFAPIDQTTHLGGELPFEEAMFDGTPRAPTPIRAATPLATAAVFDAAGGPFSFDRFFPDPATAASPQHTPVRSPTPTPASEPARDIMPPTVSDDLAQFSAWLKGLGST